MTTQDPKYKHKPSEKHTLEEVLKSLQDLIRNDLLDNDPSAAEKSGATPTSGKEKSPREPTIPAREDFSPVNPASGPVNLDAVMRSLKDLVSNELNVSGENAADDDAPPPQTEDHKTSESFADEFISLDEELIPDAGTSPLPAEARVPEAIPAKEFEPQDERLDRAEAPAPSLPEETAAPGNLADEFAPLDEELTFEESMEMVPPPINSPAMPEIPGEIFAEMLDEPETGVSPPTPPPQAEENLAPGTQHRLLFEEPPPAAKTEPPASDRAPDPDQKPQVPPEAMAPELTRETSPTPEMPGDALPTIDVEENFDENAYFEAEAKLAEADSSDTRETQEIILSALGAALEPDAAPPTNAEAQTSIEKPAPEPETATPEIKLEIANEPAMEDFKNIPSIDFDVIEFESAREEPPPPQEDETGVPADAPLTQEFILDLGLEPMSPPSVESQPDVTSDAENIPVAHDTPPVTAETGDSAPAAGPATPEKPASFSLDDIPVLHEVVAPPAGSTLAGEPGSPVTAPPLPAPDRARDIVVRAVAKLNVEMRKSGGAGLDTKTILRLQQLIRRELEKDGEKS